MLLTKKHVRVTLAASSTSSFFLLRIEAPITRPESNIRSVELRCLKTFNLFTLTLSVIRRSAAMSGEHVEPGYQLQRI